MGHRRREVEDRSLTPLIQEAEARLKQQLEQARQEAEAGVRAAEREAEEILARARAEVPLRQERRLREELARLRSEIKPDTAGRAELERRAEANLQRAVQAIVRAVWPGGDI